MKVNIELSRDEQAFLRYSAKELRSWAGGDLLEGDDILLLRKIARFLDAVYVESADEPNQAT